MWWMSDFRFMFVDEVKLVGDFKLGEMCCELGMNFILEGIFSLYFYIVLEGWGFCYKLFEDGRW